MSHQGELPQRPIGIIAAGGGMPFAVADAVLAQNGQVVIFGLRGLCDAAAIERYRHQWVTLGKFGQLLRALKSEGCVDLVLIGAMARPALSDLRFDWGTVRVLPDIVAAFRGGDDHIFKRGARIFERHGFRLLGVGDVATSLLMPGGQLTKAQPDAVAQADIVIGQQVLQAISPFDIGQAVVVIDGHVVGVEGIEGTDALLSRIADLRVTRRIRKAAGRGVLVKTPKAGQDLRFDLPTVGPRTIEGIAQAQLAGIAVAAGRAIVAEPQVMIERADSNGLFVIGISQ